MVRRTPTRSAGPAPGGRRWSRQRRGLDAEQVDGAVGLREWFERLSNVRDVAAAALDTRLDAPKLVTGQASRGIAVRLRRHGFTVVTDPESFLVDKRTALVPGELTRAVAWGRRLAELRRAPVVV